ncbi:redoxin domain-containing protein, partial [Myxococcota bacterium]|nr:redoxin domain-containing protein [Myxococcota bacterium]
KRRWPSLSVEAGYPEGPYGLREGDIIADLTFEVGDGATWRLSEARGDGARLLMLITSAGWCSSCRQEQPKIQAIADAHARAGLRPIVAIFEDGDAQPATGDYAEAWRAQYEMSVPVVADPGFQLSPYFNPGGRSMFLLIDAETMAILRIDRDFHSARSEAEALAILARL